MAGNEPFGVNGAGFRWTHIPRVSAEVQAGDSCGGFDHDRPDCSLYGLAGHRRRKAAAKLHLRLNLQSFLPRFAIVATAREGDVSRSRELCDGLKRGEVALFDKGYIHFGHLNELTQRGVIWVTRAKDNMKVKCLKRLQKKRVGNILRDDVVRLSDYNTGKKYQEFLRRVVALVELKGEWVEMTFITNELTWAAGTVADLYKRRWSIEAFLSKSNRFSNFVIFSGTVKTPSSGRSGRPC